MSAKCLIGAFNIRGFGRKKMDNDPVVHAVLRILQRYDIVLIQEVRDASGEGIENLLQQLNRVSFHQYGMIASDRLGRKSYKEQYVYLYRQSAGVRLVDSFHYDDGSERTGDDEFEREPFVTLFDVPYCEPSRIALVGVHTKPDHAAEEINRLDDIFFLTQKRWVTDDIIILGDLNASGGYMTRADWREVDLDRRRFSWLIPDDADTTVGRSECAYDRFVVLRASALSQKKASVFRFDEEYRLTRKQALEISDHYPIELSL